VIAAEECSSGLFYSKIATYILPEDLLRLIPPPYQFLNVAAGITTQQHDDGVGVQF
jgi:hypothetical protein